MPFGRSAIGSLGIIGGWVGLILPVLSPKFQRVPVMTPPVILSESELPVLTKNDILAMVQKLEELMIKVDSSMNPGNYDLVILENQRQDLLAAINEGGF